MLKSIHVDGLKSLNDFKLKLQPGLNVLIGPNGSGKSNILAAFDLTAHISHLDSLNSNGHIGASEIDQLFDIYRSDKKIAVTVEGETETSFSDELTATKFKHESIDLKYRFEFELTYNPQISNKLQFSKQFLDLVLTSKESTAEHKFRIESFDNKSKLIIADDIFLGNMTMNSTDGNQSATSADQLESLINRGEFLRYRSIVQELSLLFSPLKSVLNELKSGSSYAIDPISIRRSFNISGEPIVKNDGTGLQSVLLEICEKIYKPEYPLFSPDHLYKNYDDIYKTINVYLKEFLPKLNHFIVECDGRIGRISGKMEYNNGLKLPIELLSDGSLKLLTLLTVLLTKRNMILLEEPENFLQPQMQQEIVELMRETAEDGNDVRLITTHSETIINSAEPEEIIYTKYKDERTQAGRFENLEKIKEAINDSGNGLGWYYVNGAIDNKKLV